MRFRYAALTDIGLRRQKNEDAYVIEEKHNNYLFGIADGMGGHACGEIASRLACQELKGFIHNCSGQEYKYIRHQLKQRFFQIDSLLRMYPVENRHCDGMGTTLSAIVFFKLKAIVAHVGDSRIHRLDSTNFTKLTTDHSFVEEMVKEGLMSSTIASNHPFKNKLTQAIGTSEPVETVQLTTLPVIAGDRYVLSTDGLHNGVEQEEMKEIISTTDTPHDAAKQLLNLALQRGGKDNITVITIFLE